jgi:membrane protein implicated in regulation of membrane protease activity
MTWETFYATCFVVGLLLSILSFLGGALHLHIPKGLHLHTGGIHAHGGGGSVDHGARGASFFNFGTITAFLAWFGGTGLLLTRHSSLWALLALALSTVSGLAGASIVFWFMFKVLLADERDLDPADYSMIGVLGRVSSTVRESGVGEMIFSQEGVRRCVSIRSETGTPIARGTEVVVTQYKSGIAYVRPWEEMSEMDSAPESERFSN